MTISVWRRDVAGELVTVISGSVWVVMRRAVLYRHDCYLWRVRP